MIQFKEAYDIVVDSRIQVTTERIHYLKSLGNVLAENVISDMDMPPFDKSAMDGYACRYEDIRGNLKVLEIIQAGNLPQFEIGKNQCSKIMTGAMMPKGANCVIMHEDTVSAEDGVIKYTREIAEGADLRIENITKRKLNICYKAEDIKNGDVVIEKGTIIKAQHIAIMASVGYTNALIVQKPKVAIIPTGSEIVEPDNVPTESQIRNSNGSQLIAQLQNIGIEANYYGIAVDTEKETMELIQKAYSENDLVILTGGVSKGDYDLVPDILEKLQFEILFHEIALQPGKPTIFAKRGDKYCFGLPGNPVSSFVQLELFIKPLLYNWMGVNYKPVDLSLFLAKDYNRKQINRLALLPISITEQGEAIQVEYHGSAHINGFDKVWGLMFVPIGVKEIKKGERVNVRQI